jgi:hypothetical protein
VILRRVCGFRAWLQVSSGAFRGSGIGGNIQGAGFAVFTSYTVQKPHGGRRSAGAGLLCDLGGVCLSLSACRTIGAGLLMSVGYQGAAQTFAQVFETSVRK